MNSFFNPFNKESRRQLLAAARVETFPAGRRIFEEADPSDGVCLVESGAVEIVKRISGEREAVLAVIGPGDYFGEMGVIDGCGRSAGARAAEDSELTVIPAGAFLETLRAAPSRVSLHFLRHIGENLRSTNARYIAEALRKEKLEAVGEMAASIIHDFRNPISAIKLTSELLRMVGNPSPETVSFCAGIERQVEHMAAMVQDILDYTRGESRLEKERMTVEELFAEAGNLSGDFLRRAGINCLFEPAAAAVEVDRNRFLRVFQNLLSNAAEALGEAGGEITVRAAAAAEGDIEFRVADTGPGVPESIRETLFEPFVTAGKRRGSGLGLAIARTIVEAHGGTISLETGKDGGTVFIIRLPRAAEISHP